MDKVSLKISALSPYLFSNVTRRAGDSVVPGGVFVEGLNGFGHSSIFRRCAAKVFFRSLDKFLTKRRQKRRGGRGGRINNVSMVGFLGVS
ncbi:hypothetical protein O3M35_012766 [Rhynocoris fuscipes]|uniref:Uncharacterized protein n=1 Tax=Rhynocoris fuscipes TaxID=488301 RepID=A0AAW1D1G2_9HEMI